MRQPIPIHLACLMSVAAILAGLVLGVPLLANAQLFPAAASTPPNIMIILDSSYSMSEKMGGESKMAIAKRTVMDVLRNITPGTRVGLRVYGNTDNGFTSCRATDLLVPLGENNRALIASKMIGIKPTGSTPISYAIQRSLTQDFYNAPGPKTIILVSDGMETCGEDPCDVAVRMQKQGIQVKMDVVGLGLRDYDATRQLQCVALATKGKFYSANTAADLANSLTQALAIKTNVQASVIVPQTVNTEAAKVVAPQAPPEVQSSGTSYQEKSLPAERIKPRPVSIKGNKG